MRYLCLAVIPPDRISRLRTLDLATYHWIFANAWTEANEIIRTRPIDLAIFDPLMHGEPGIAEVEQLRTRFPSLPLLLYTTLSPATASVLLRLGQLGVRRAIFARFEDAPENLRRILAQELEYTAIQQVMRSLDPALRKLPRPLRLALEMSLHILDEPMNTTTLAEQAGMTRYECQTWFARAHLPVPRVVMILLRLAYAHRLLLDPGYTIDDVARKLGYGKTRTLQAQLRIVFGMTAGELRQFSSPDEALLTLIDRYFTASLQNINSGDLIAARG